MSNIVPEDMVHGSPENVKKAGHPRHPVVHGGLPSGDDEEDDARAEKTKKPPWPPRSVSTEASNDETPAGHSLYPLVAVVCFRLVHGSPTETKNHNQGHHHHLKQPPRVGKGMSSFWGLLISAARKKSASHRRSQVYHAQPLGPRH
uniref:Uncharacterized protein n=1 Tax=Fagus sylvatica TaxID=28930 RepID=A0A2N9EG61_FAGSY